MTDDCPHCDDARLCDECARLEELEAGRDHEEEDHQDRLLRVLPDGDYTASEMREYLS